MRSGNLLGAIMGAVFPAMTNADNPPPRHFRLSPPIPALPVGPVTTADGIPNWPHRRSYRSHQREAAKRRNAQ